MKLRFHPRRRSSTDVFANAPKIGRHSNQEVHTRLSREFCDHLREFDLLLELAAI
jgi:hypothetical protein